MKVDINPGSDGLEAKLAIRDFDPGEWRSRYPGKESLVSHLVGLGLVQDLVEESAVASVCSLLSGEGSDTDSTKACLSEVQGVVLASGRPPLDEVVEGLMFRKAYLSESGEIEAVERKLAESGLEEAQREVPAGSRVEAGETILTFDSIRGGRPGMDVFGNPVPFKPYTAGLPAAGPGISRLDRKWVAKAPGILVLQGNVLKVLGEADVHPEYIRVAEDNLAAWLILEDGVMPREADTVRTLENIQAAMARLGIGPFRERDRVAAALGAYLGEGLEQATLLVEGTSPRSGKDGRVELLVNPEPELPDADAADKVDFRTFTFFRTVTRGQPLARIIPPEKGRAGVDIFGKALPARDGLPVRVLPGMNTEAAPDNPALLVAAKSGKLTVDKGIPYVVDTLKVAEDVSFRTGNLTFPGSIEVEGNVMDKFAIDAKGDVGIGGVVENGTVVSEGSIIIKGGVIGGGGGLIKSKLSSVTIGYIRNQRIESHSNIVVYNEVLNAQLLARGALTMKSGSHSLIGGTALAFRSIEVFNAGNQAGAKTILEVGKDFEVEAEIARKREYLKAVRADLEFLERKSERLALIVRWEAGRSAENRLIEQRVNGVAKLLEKVKRGLAAKLGELEQALYNPEECFIAVKGTAYPGTLLRYRDKVISITEPVHNKRWVFKRR